MPALDSGTLIPCSYGYHLCRREDVVHWLGPAIFTAEHRGRLLVSDNKVVTAEARLLVHLETWNERTARLFVADCAEHVLYLFEDDHPGDDRPRKAIVAARSAAENTAESAAWSAADSAADSAAWSAAWSAAESAAWSAADSAADSAAWSAVRSAAGRAEREWQVERLFEHLEGKRS
jgi:hypothetical protein